MQLRKPNAREFSLSQSKEQTYLFNIKTYIFFVVYDIAMCELCANSDLRSYSHSKTNLHKKKLIQLFKEKKYIAEKLFGGYYMYV